MTILANFPMVSQLTPITSDGVPSPNGPFDCVAASLCAVILSLEGETQVSSTGWNPDKVLDLAYPEGYHGATDAHAYVAPLAKEGFVLSWQDGTPAELVTLAHTLIQKGTPVIFTEIDPYVPASYGWSHVCVWYGESPGSLTALDPYIGKPVTKSDGEWEAVLQFNQVWILQKKEESMRIDISTAEIAGRFTALNSHQWQCKSTGKIVQYGMLDYYMTNGTLPYCGLSSAGLPLSNEVPVEKIDPAFARFAGHGMVVQFFERQNWIYDPSHLLDNPPGSGPVYPLHLTGDSPGVDPLIKQLNAQLSQMQAQLVTLQKPAAPDPLVQNYQQRLTQIHDLSAV